MSPSPVGLGSFSGHELLVGTPELFEISGTELDEVAAPC